ncbi:MAG: glycosyltransferase family 4 protein [Deltaproteobacteria bacterium]|nr:glycosyltransferase family 4 protein [Deltaproteobacteria bacterium]
MNTLAVAHVLRKYDADELGGTETHVAEITRRLNDLGVHCEVHAPAGPRAGGNLAVPLFRYKAFSPFLGPKAQRRALVQNAGNLVSLDEPLRLYRDRSLSLVHVHTTGRIGGGVRTAMKLSKRPYIVSVHGPLLSGGAFLQADTARRLSGVIDLGQPFGLLLGARRVIDDAARVLCFNDDEHAALQRRIGARAVRMDHGVDAARFTRGNAAHVREAWPALGEAPLVVQVGRLCVQKDQLLTLRAFARVAAQHRLVFVGQETDRGYRAQLEAEARALGIAERVHFLGNLPPHEVPDVLAAATLMVAPSQHEAFGLLVLEAWAAKKACVFSRVGGLADLARVLDATGPGAGAVALTERSPEAFAAQLQVLLGDAQLREAAAARGHALVQQRFSWDTAAERLHALYREVLDERARRSA